MLKKNCINDVTTLNPVKVAGVLYPQSIEEIQDIVKNYKSISVGGGHYSMGGQTACKNSVHVDMREYNKILHLDTEKKEITVNAGITWKEIQKEIDKYDLSISIMQTYSNFTVGGSLSVNVHGRYIGAGPLALSIKEFRFIDVNAEEQKASREKNREYFEMLVGGYGSIGIVTDITLCLAENVNVKQINKKMRVSEYLQNLDFITKDEKSVFHNADIYPPHYNKVNSVTWVKTEDAVTQKKRIQDVRKFYPLEMYALWAISSTPFGPLRREYLYDKVIFAKPRVYKRNYEASYDVAELEPLSRKNSTYVLQEYFIPKENAESFIQKIAKVFVAYNANILNISIRHSIANTDSLLSWSRSEVLAFVVYYKQGTSQKEKDAVAVWTRKAIDAAISEGGTYYLPYQPHATKEQLLQAYPNFEVFAKKKKEFDPEYKFRNSLFEKYIYQENTYDPKNFYDILHKDEYKDKLYDFLLYVFRSDEKRVFHSTLQGLEKYEDSDEIYNYIQKECQLSAKILLSPSSTVNIIKQLLIQNKMIKEQTKELLGHDIYDALFIEPTDIKKPSKFYSKTIPLDIDKLLGNFPVKATKEFYIKEGESLIELLQGIDENSLDLITVYGGLHHIEKEKRLQIHKLIYKRLRNNGVFILREHDVCDDDMFKFVSLIHAVFNAVTGESLKNERSEVREFESIETIVDDIEMAGFKDSGKRLKQYGDPSENILLAFEKKSS
ncbi:FAD-binding protein [Sulfurimonas paralvinellae]|uniref:FAD-binding oxidoreductase n=1 Tax=Sulfurimonas paralvinellae TaxID=317658 RepID=A0A7M1BAH2_9BACT|nr:FAD-binding oxidoreductase [Sulfurimonas paralvinellae]QOP46426.1 FAD-binding oxidoreductase [Sulfurimonas paralvinellae]